MKTPAAKPREDRRQEDVEQCARWLTDYGDDLLVYALSRVQDRDVAEDLVQETYLAAFQGMHQFEERSSARTWLIGILRHKVADFFRRKSRQETRVRNTNHGDAPADELFNEQGFWRTTPQRWSPDPSTALENEEFWRVFDECRAKLPPAVAITFVLRELDQLETDEICATLNISQTNFSVRMHRARAALRACLEQNWFSSSHHTPRDAE